MIKYLFHYSKLREWNNVIPRLDSFMFELVPKNVM